MKSPRNRLKPRPSVTSEGGQLRIIGGQWRSRRLSFPAVPGLRPTPDRVRETLFNWLTGEVEGARVLDPFAGSGALLLEALSRGASSGLGFDASSAAVASLRSNLALLKADNGEIRQGDALALLSQAPATTYDLVLLDPPFHQDLLMKACDLLEQHNWLNPRAWIYCESEQAPSSLGLPAHWRLHREKQAGQVHYSLWQRQA